MGRLTQPAFVYGVASAVRLVLIAFGEWQDRSFRVKYTDIDYEVFTDAAALVARGDSPFDRATYRYSPFLAYLLVPNVLFHRCWGKLLFSAADLVVGWCLQGLLRRRSVPRGTAVRYSALWLLNPLSINVSTRGSFDSITSALVLCTTLAAMDGRVTLAAALFGIVVHLRVYPIIYSLSLVLFLASTSGAWGRSSAAAGGGAGFSLKSLLSWRPLLFTGVSASTFLVCTGLCTWKHGEQFLWNALFYHLTRADNRHNYSMYWYWIYLDQQAGQPRLLGLAAFVPQVVLLVASAVRFHRDPPFCIFLQTAIFVVYNKVCTGQYFTWYLCLAPLLLPKLRIGRAAGGASLAAWVSALAVWLFFAWHLEIQGNNTFLPLWAASVSFFLTNVCLLAGVVRAYTGG